MQPETIFQIIVIVYSVILHEVAHGYAAYVFGDKTAYYQNRLTLNPVPHVDLVGSILLPTILILSNSSLLAGWAKPVPVSESNLNPYKFGSFVVSIVGVLTNLVLAIVFTVIGMNLEGESVRLLCSVVAITNIGLAIFNLIPVPPADGYRILSIFLPFHTKRKIENFIQQNFIVTIILAILIATQIFTIIFPIFYHTITSLIFR